MSVRSTAFVASALVLALVFIPGAPAKRPPPPTPSDKTPPTAPSNLRITANSATSISLAWNPSTDNSANWWYCVQVDGAGCYRVDPPQTTFTHPRLAPNRTTTWTVVALDAAGNRSGSSNSVAFTTPPDLTAPSPAPTLSATAIYPTRISLSWTESVDDTSQVWYTLLVNGSAYLSDVIGYGAATVLYLSPSTTYGFKVRVRDAYGNTAESNVLSVTTPAPTDTVAPTAPANLRFSFQTSPPEAWLQLGPVHRRHRSAVADPVRGVRERHTCRRKHHDRIQLDDRLLPRRRPDHIRRESVRRIRKHVAAEQRARPYLLTG